MRFHKLTLTNVNSLYDTHELDFDQVAGEGGMFLIRGVTGAGKSTVLDGIALALFGVTPRLRSTGATSIDGSKEGAAEDAVMRVMSRGAGRCSAVLEFSVQDEKHERRYYRASWGVHRAREKADGAFQKIMRTLEERIAGEWKVLVDTHMPTVFAPIFSTALRGLTFDDFERTTLLAQFKFREFLDAGEVGRTRILERMTGTDRFRVIGARAATERKTAAEHVRDLKVELGALTVWSDDERRTKESLLESARLETTRTRTLHDEARDRRDHVAQGLKLFARVHTAHEERDTVMASRDAHRTTLEALADDERVAPARTALALLHAARKTRENVDGMLAAARGAEATARAHHAASEAAVKAKAITRDEAIVARDAALPAIAEAQEAWRAAKQATSHAQAAAESLSTRESEARTARAALDAAVEALRRCDDGVADVDAKLREIPAWELLPTAAPEVKGKAAVLDDARGDVARALALVTTKRGERDVLRAALPELAAALEVATRDHDAHEKSLAHAAAALRTLLDCVPFDAAIAAEEARVAECEKREKDLEKLHTALQERTAAEAHHAQLLVLVASDRTAHAAAEATLREKQHVCKLHEDALAAKKALLHALEELLGVLAHRGALKANEPCPVCGADDHPYREHPERAPKLEEKQGEREVAARAVHEAEAALTAARGEEAKAVRSEGQTKTALEKDEASLAEASSRVASAVEAVHTLEGSLGLAGSTEGGVRDALAAEATTKAGAGDRMKALRAAQQAVGDAERSTSESREKKQASESSRREHAVRMEALEAALGDAEENLAEERRGETEALADLERMLTPLELAFGDLRARADEASHRAEAVTGLIGLREEHEAARQRAEVDRATTAVRSEDSLELVAAARAHASETAERESQAKNLARTLLGGEDPDTVRARLEAAIEAARKDLEGAQAAATTSSNALAQGEARVTEKTSQLDVAGAAESSARRAFEEACALARLTTEAEVEMLSLAEAARTAAMKVRRDLEDAEQAAKARVDEAEMVWRAHRAAAPLDLADDGLVLTPELLAALERRAGEALQLADTAVRAEAALEQEFAADREARGGVEERVRNLEVAEADLAQWEIVHELIGMGEGERFAKVVQALNLQKVLDRANANLQRFMPRYALVQVTHPTEGPKLDFRVTDREHQDAARTIKSLSGGESFVVSLALALGLAATRSSSLRIETLLIDEGFGALDARTLETATAALTALQGALGVRIGLISHVEYLKEAIPAQFVVETLGGGRSRVVASP